MSGAGQETRPFDTYRNVYEVDIDPVLYTRICIAILSTVSLHFLPPFMGLQTYVPQKQSHTPLGRHERRLQEVPYSTHIPNFTS